MAIEILKNDENDILYGQDGNVFRTPYNFGNAFQNRMGLGNYIDISGLSFSSNYSFLIWCDFVATQAIVRSFFTIYNGANYYSLNHYINSRLSVSYNNISNVGYDLSYLTIGSGLSLVCLSVDNLDCLLRHNASTATYAGALAANIPIDRISIGLFNAAANNAANKYNRFVVFNRRLTSDEYLYYYSNRQGNDLMLEVGLELDLHMQQAEVINISGVDQPCVRDYSGFDRHGPITSLPAGTVQQKVDYANANLFVPLINS